jgi:hypothetical protein
MVANTSNTASSSLHCATFSKAQLAKCMPFSKVQTGPAEFVVIQTLQHMTVSKLSQMPDRQTSRSQPFLPRGAMVANTINTASSSLHSALS